MSVSYDEVLINGSEDELAEYMWAYDKNVIVDWRGDDDEVVKEVAKIIDEPDLSAKYTDDGLKIIYKGEEFDLPYSSFSPLEKARYITINKVRELIKNNYEIRVWRESTFSDTHSLYIKENDWWKFMDEKFPDNMNQLFVKITETTEFE